MKFGKKNAKSLPALHTHVQGDDFIFMPSIYIIPDHITCLKDQGVFVEVNFAKKLEVSL